MATLHPPIPDGSREIRVLIVDDDEEDFALTSDLLSDSVDVSYVTDWASSYAEALERILSESFDVFLFDQHLGGHTGVELLESVRDTGVLTPVIMLTGVTDEVLDRLVMRRGASDFLVKGEFTLALLERSIRYAIEHRRLMAEMEAAAQHDPLTGLANRRHFRAFLRGAIARSERSQRRLGILFIDLDHFKQINDRYGHEAGDKLLVDVAGLLTSSVRNGDLAARFGGDEFTVVLDDIGEASNAERIARKVLETFGSAKLGLEAGVGVSIGVAVWPDDGNEIDEVINAADLAMYQAKKHGRSHFQRFEARAQTAANRRSELRCALERALSRNEIIVNYQPQVAASRSRIVGFEALMRWNRGDSGPISPDEFIPLAEESGLIVELGDWILQTACSQFCEWERQGLLADKQSVAVNVSVHQLTAGGLLDKVDAVLNKTGLDPYRLELEITESAALVEVARAVEEIKGLRERGVRIALDDFGTGHSSFRYLLELPIQTIKIDRSFVQSCVRSEEGAALVKATVALAHSLGLSIVAEGVETEQQRLFLLDNSCAIMQGFMFYRPMSAADTLGVLQDRANVTPEVQLMSAS